MIFVDYVLIAILIVSIVIGALRGFLREAVAFVSWIVALFLAWTFSSSLEPYLGAWLAEHPQMLTWVARLLILVSVLVIGAIIGSLLGHFVRLSIFSGLDRFLGILFGGLRGLIVIGVLVIFGQLLHMDAEAWWGKSVLIPQATSIANGVRAFVGEHWPPQESSLPVKA
jgi:membrane protein required for colicin V production